MYIKLIRQRVYQERMINHYKLLLSEYSSSPCKSVRTISESIEHTHYIDYLSKKMYIDVVQYLTDRSLTI
jgi:hypothetical protein